MRTFQRFCAVAVCVLAALLVSAYAQSSPLPSGSSSLTAPPPPNTPPSSASTGKEIVSSESHASPNVPDVPDVPVGSSSTSSGAGSQPSAGNTTEAPARSNGVAGSLGARASVCFAITVLAALVVA